MICVKMCQISQEHNYNDITGNGQLLRFQDQESVRRERGFYLIHKPIGLQEWQSLVLKYVQSLHFIPDDIACSNEPSGYSNS